jgi:hypothetical protein
MPMSTPAPEVPAKFRLLRILGFSVMVSRGEKLGVTVREQARVISDLWKLQYSTVAGV